MPSSETASPLELAWTAIGLIGVLAITPVLAWYVYGLWKLKHDGVNSGDEMLAWTWLGVVGGLWSKLFAILVMGIAADIAPPAPPNSRGITKTAIIVTAGLIWIGVSAMLSAIFVFVQQIRLRRYIRRQIGSELLHDLVRKVHEAEEGC